MKKTISIILALAMVFVMSFACFAEIPDEVFDKYPTDVNDEAAWTEYYTEVLKYAETDTQDVIMIIAGDFTVDTNNKVVMVKALTAALQNAALDSDLVQTIINGIKDMIGNLPTLPELPSDGTLPSDFDPSLTVPEGGEGEGGGFFDTIFGILGGIIDSIFNPNGGDAEEDPTDPDDEDSFDDDFEDEDFGDEDDSEVPNTGDRSVLAVTVVAVAAGAALLLTKKSKKNEDAE